VESRRTHAVPNNDLAFEVHDPLTVSDSLTVSPYPKALLSIAQRLIEQGDFNIAVVTSHLACEVAAELAIEAAYAAKTLEPLGEAVDALMNGHNLGNDKHRDLYNALTGDELQKQPFWSQFKEASTKRNSIVHKRGHANKAEAETALQAATHLIRHLKQL
jgi:hypothetical protein